MKRYSVTGITASGSSIKHVVRAQTDADAEARFRRAYPAQTWRSVTARAIGEALA